MKGLTILTFCALIYSCSPTKTYEDPLLHILETSENLQEVYQHAEKYELQVIYTQIDRDSLQVPTFTSYTFGIDSVNYFYPASTVKFPAALLALEKMNQLRRSDISRETPFLIDSAHSGQTPAWADSTSSSGLPSIGHYIKKILLVSDNDAFNRLYEFIGQKDFNDQLRKKGFPYTRIGHRLSIALTVDENAHTNPWRFVEGDSILLSDTMQFNRDTLWPTSSILRGKAYFSRGERKEEPMDFRTKNFFPLTEQHDMLKRVLFPEAYPEASQFQLTPSDYAFLYRYMSQLPSETTYPDYTTLPNNYVKYIYAGNDRDYRGDSIRIFNKIGQAYGYLTDNAYVVDLDNHIEYILSVTVFTNDNQTFNDNNYEYDEISIPFMTELGKAIYQWERNRKRNITPDLSRFNIDYDK